MADGICDHSKAADCAVGTAKFAECHPCRIVDLQVEVPGAIRHGIQGQLASEIDAAAPHPDHAAR